MIPKHLQERVVGLMEGFVESADKICRSADMDFEAVGLLVFRQKDGTAVFQHGGTLHHADMVTVLEEWLRILKEDSPAWQTERPIDIPIPITGRGGTA